ncbi:Uncharacterised protein [Mycobacteroides abscessus subsp. abscessus]|nr:Uncharacterised protein [Mycobacteroides abscessus subsp. abscessus]
MCLANRDGLAAALQRDVASRDLKGRTRGGSDLGRCRRPGRCLAGRLGHLLFGVLGCCVGVVVDGCDDVLALRDSGCVAILGECGAGVVLDLLG